MPTSTGLFIFHRDLRIQDNVGLSAAAALCDKLYVAFIFDPRQVSPQMNNYRSATAIRFMIESLEHLEKDIHEKTRGRFIVLHGGSYTKVLQSTIAELNVEVVLENRDYTPFAIERQEETRRVCETAGASHRLVSCDYYLFEPGTVLSKGTDKSYKKFTPFYHEIMKRPLVVSPAPTPKKTETPPRLQYEISLKRAMELFGGGDGAPDVPGGRKEGLLRLNRSLTTQRDYDETRDNIFMETSRLSPYLKFGCVSIREVCAKFGKKTAFVSQLFWRDFYAHVLFSYPSSPPKGHYPHLKWRTSNKDFDKWKSGQTGVPLIDAGMRQLNATGYMHNRVRMAVAQFLCKTLYLDWRLGERHFAQHLTDYDVASNHGNWRTIASVGVDFSPYYNTMNPYIQTRKFDPECEYVKKWVPELRTVAPRDILRWDDPDVRNKYKTIVKYIAPMCDYAVEKKKLKYYYGV